MRPIVLFLSLIITVGAKAQNEESPSAELRRLIEGPEMSAELNTLVSKTTDWLKQSMAAKNAVSATENLVERCYHLGILSRLIFKQSATVLKNLINDQTIGGFFRRELDFITEADAENHIIGITNLFLTQKLEDVVTFCKVNKGSHRKRFKRMNPKWEIYQQEFDQTFDKLKVLFELVVPNIPIE